MASFDSLNTASTWTASNLSPFLHFIGHAGRGITGIFFWGGKVIFPDSFPGVKWFLPVKISHFGRSKTNFCRFQMWKAQKIKSTKKKKRERKSSSPLFITFPTSISNFPPSLLQFSQFSFFSSQFSPLFPFFPCLFFPNTSAKLSRSEISGGALCPPAPRLLRHCMQGSSQWYIWAPLHGIPHWDGIMDGTIGYLFLLH